MCFILPIKHRMRNIVIYLHVFLFRFAFSLYIKCKWAANFQDTRKLFKMELPHSHTLFNISRTRFRYAWPKSRDKFISSTCQGIATTTTTKFKWLKMNMRYKLMATTEPKYTRNYPFVFFWIGFGGTEKKRHSIAKDDYKKETKNPNEFVITGQGNLKVCHSIMTCPALLFEIILLDYWARNKIRTQVMLLYIYVLYMCLWIRAFELVSSVLWYCLTKDGVDLAIQQNVCVLALNLK